mmetsp:Transcript_9766/g.40028  ORF Transcript_9766/g.40028 Transcript_9766/m.40028 type:complete len:335 (+) Transcript_9766:413-1417(+)
MRRELGRLCPRGVVSTRGLNCGSHGGDDDVAVLGRGDANRGAPASSEGEGVGQELGALRPEVLPAGRLLVRASLQKRGEVREERSRERRVALERDLEEGSLEAASLVGLEHLERVPVGAHRVGRGLVLAALLLQPRHSLEHAEQVHGDGGGGLGETLGVAAGTRGLGGGADRQFQLARDGLPGDRLGSRARRKVLGVAHRLGEDAADALSQRRGLGRTGDERVLHGAQEGHRRAGEVRRRGLALGVQLDEGEHAELEVPGSPHQVLLAVDILAPRLERLTEELVDAKHGVVVHGVRGVLVRVRIVVIGILERAGLDERSLDRRGPLLVEGGVVV